MPATKEAETKPVAATPVIPQEKDDVLGIISLVASFCGFAPVGFVLGLVGVSQAKKEGRSPTLSRIGWILGLVFMVLITILILVIAIVIIVADPEERSNRNGSDTFRESLNSRVEEY